MRSLVLMTALSFAASAGAAEVPARVSAAVQERGVARIAVRVDRSSSLRGAVRVGDTVWIDADAETLEQLGARADVLQVDVDPGGHGGDAESLPLIGGNTVHALGYRGDGVVVAVLDSGIDASHPDLADALVDEQCFCDNFNGTGCCPNGKAEQSGRGSATDDHGHGTNVIGIIASRGTVAPIGVAPGAKIVAVKVLDRNNRFVSTAQVVQGLQWVLDHHPEVRVVNLSLLTNALFDQACDSTTSFTTAMADVINKLGARGVAVFACTGNEGSAKSIGAPACIHNVIAVGAVYDSAMPAGTFGCSDKPPAADEIACFSNGNSLVDLYAPGAIIRSTGIGNGTSDYVGTSQASPHAAGAAAVLFAMKPALTGAVVESLLKSTGKPLFDSRTGYSAARIDVLRAVQAAGAPNTHRRATAR